MKTLPGSLVLGLLLSSITSVQADEALLAALPGGAPVVVQVKGFHRVQDRLKATLTHGGDETKKWVETLQSAMGPLKGRTVTGLAGEGRLFIVLIDLPSPDSDANPQVGLFAQVKDYAAFRDGLLTETERKSITRQGDVERVTVEEEEFYFGRRGDFVVVTPDKSVAENYAAGQGKLGLGKELTADVRRRLLDHDVCLYVNLGHVNKVYEQQIAMIRGMMDMGLGQVSELGGLPKSFGSYFKQVFEAMVQGFIDSRVLLVLLDFEPTGIKAALHIGFGDKSVTSTALSRLARTHELNQLAKMPVGQHSYQSVDYGDFWSVMGPMSLGITMSDDAEVAKKQKEALEAFMAAGPGPMLYGMRQLDDAVYTWDFVAPAQANEALWKLYTSLKPGEHYAMMLKITKVDAQAEPVTHRGHQFRHLALEWEAADLPDEIAGQFKSIYGTGYKAWMGVVGAQWVMVTSKDWETAKATIDRLLDGKEHIGTLPSFASLRGRLPAKASLYATGDLGYLLSLGFMAGSGLGSGSIIPSKRSKQESWFGLAVELNPGFIHVEVWLPAKALNDTIKAIQSSLEMPGEP
jgi:hypothetical protein